MLNMLSKKILNHTMKNFQNVYMNLFYIFAPHNPQTESTDSRPIYEDPKKQLDWYPWMDAIS